MATRTAPTAAPTATPGLAGRRGQQRGRATRHELLEAALREFASVGFDAASTRAIAARAGVHQGQLTYHFETKAALWRATVDHLFQRFDSELAAALPAGTHLAGLGADQGDAADPAEVFADSVRALVRAVSRLPELNRVMVHEATANSERLTWLVDTHVRRRFEEVGRLWAQVQAAGATHLQIDAVMVYYCLLGAASLLYVNAPEARLLAGTAPAATLVTDQLVNAHADALVAMMLGPRTTPAAVPHTTTKGN